MSDCEMSIEKCLQCKLVKTTNIGYGCTLCCMVTKKKLKITKCIYNQIQISLDEEAIKTIIKTRTDNQDKKEEA